MNKKFEIIKLRKMGYTINQIVDTLKCAKSTVSFHINNAELGGNINDILYKTSNSDIDKIIELRRNKKTYLEISKLINISEDRLIKICRKYKLNKGINTFEKSFDKSEVLKYYKIYKSLRVTAKHFNVTRDTIRKHIDDSDIIYCGKYSDKKISKSQSVIEWRKRKKIELVEYKGGCCELCGYDKSISALHFHHRNPEEKDFSISSKSYSISKLKKEVDKCILVCSNCHSEIHDKLK